jgi:hypothetical protein
MDAFEGCDYDLLDVMDPWGMTPAVAADKADGAADRENARFRASDRE